MNRCKSITAVIKTVYKLYRTLLNWQILIIHKIHSMIYCLRFNHRISMTKKKKHPCPAHSHRTPSDPGDNPRFEALQVAKMLWGHSAGLIRRTRWHNSSAHQKPPDRVHRWQSPASYGQPYAGWCIWQRSELRNLWGRLIALSNKKLSWFSQPARYV